MFDLQRLDFKESSDLKLFIELVNNNSIYFLICKLKLETEFKVLHNWPYEIRDSLFSIFQLRNYRLQQWTTNSNTTKINYLLEKKLLSLLQDYLRTFWRTRAYKMMRCTYIKNIICTFTCSHLSETMYSYNYRENQRV